MEPLVVAKAQSSASISAEATIVAEVLHVDTATGKKFTGDRAPKTAAEGDGSLATLDAATLYKDTTCYTFSSGYGVKDDTIEFKNDSSTTLGTWSGKMKATVKKDFAGAGSWE